MSKKVMIVDDLLELVQDKRVISTLTTRLGLSTSLNSTMETMFLKFTENFISTFQQIMETFANDLTTNAMTKLHQKISNLVDENKTLSRCLNELDINAHRMLPGVNIKHRPLLIRFSSRRARNLIYFDRKSLRSGSRNTKKTQVYLMNTPSKELRMFML